MDDPLLSTPAGDTIPEKGDDSTEFEADPKDDSVVLAQPTVNQLVIPLTLSANPPRLKILQLRMSRTFLLSVTRSHKTPQPPELSLFLSFLL